MLVALEIRKLQDRGRRWRGLVPIRVPVLCRQKQLTPATVLSLCIDTLSPPHKTNDVNDEDEVQIETNDSGKSASKGDREWSRVWNGRRRLCKQEIIGGTAVQGFSYAYDIIAVAAPLGPYHLVLCMDGYAQWIDLGPALSVR